ncbi:hypothetical protein ACTWP5_22085 [Streptomyces sp. 4N509B]|uniref:hypothetical protein n=1 Tax=Streptomyces sp. 4N509B TaxID=3457413 RepID=UPI003FD337C1
MRIGLLLRELHHSENALVTQLFHVSERHRADHDIHYLARDLAGWSQRHVREIADVGDRFGVALDAEPAGEPALAGRLREKGSVLAGRRGEVALLVLRDLRRIYVEAAGVVADWDMVAQAAQGTKDTELLALARRCEPDTVRQMQWARAKLRESSPQILIST